MAGLLSSLKRGNQDQAQASSAATAAWLLEWNQKFEQFMRAKVGELEARVAAQQARISTRAKEEERAWADELTHFDDLEEYPGGEDDFLSDGPVAVEEAEDVVEEAEDTSPDYIGLMGGSTSPAPVGTEDALEGGSLETSSEVMETAALPTPVDTEGTLGDDEALEASLEVMEPADLPTPVSAETALEGEVVSGGDGTPLAAEQIDQSAAETTAGFFTRELEDDFWAYDDDDDEEEIQPASLLSDQGFLDIGLHPEDDNLEVEEAPDDEANLLPDDTGLHPEGGNLEVEEAPGDDSGLHPEDDKLEVAEEPGDEANLLPVDTGLHPEDSGLEAWETELPDQTPEDYKWVNLD
ncbi:MAG: hypothetical protein GY792_02265 [Gammaproteobacteria bacterium]|nr:hypothetical protein [Gammaproteobacteria bacterium]